MCVGGSLLSARCVASGDAQCTIICNSQSVHLIRTRPMQSSAPKAPTNLVLAVGTQAGVSSFALGCTHDLKGSNLKKMLAAERQGPKHLGNWDSMDPAAAQARAAGCNVRCSSGPPRLWHAAAGPYTSAERVWAVKVDKAIIIQRYARGWMARRRFVWRLLQHCQHVFCSERRCSGNLRKFSSGSV